MSSDPVNLSLLEDIIARYEGGNRSDLLPMLFDAQGIYGYLPDAVLDAVSHTLRVPLADIHGVVEFYTLFYAEPVGRRIIRVCTDPSCSALGGEDVLAAACRKAGGIHPGETSADSAVTVERMTCIGLCDQAPAALVNDTARVRVQADDVEALFSADTPDSALQVTGDPRILTANIGTIDATDLDAHRAAGAFTAFEKALTSMQPFDVIETIIDARLVGRGGAAFPTGLKWRFTRGAVGSTKYVVCNADESEPGTFKDRVLLEGDPFCVLEGMMLAGFAIGAREGYMFIRGEYARAREVMREAVDALYAANLLGDNILGTDFSYDVVIRSGAGAYICGEETALFEAIEGKRGFPRVKPPFPTTHGLFNKPTVVNNVETLANVGAILREGARWYHQWGTEKSTGLKLYCLSGHVNKPGVVEAPMGITLRELVDRYGGGFRGETQAVLLGGAAGTFVTPQHFDTPLTYEDLRPLGASLGSGAVMAFDTSVDMRQVLKQVAHFFAHESCGKCFPCQLGTQRQMEILDRAAGGRALPGDRDALDDVCATMTDASICGLGQTAGMATMSALKLWPGLLD